MAFGARGHDGVRRAAATMTYGARGRDGLRRARGAGYKHASCLAVATTLEVKR